MRLGRSNHPSIPSKISFTPFTEFLSPFGFEQAGLFCRSLEIKLYRMMSKKDSQYIRLLEESISLKGLIASE